MKFTTSISKLGIFCCLLGLTFGQGDFSGFKLFQAKPKDDKHKALLNQMDEYFPEDVVDFWSNPNEETVEFLVKSELVEQIGELLGTQNVTYRIKVDDFQVVVDEQFRHIRDAEGEFAFRDPGGERPDPYNDFDLYNYHRLDDIEQYITQLESSGLVTVKTLGQTYEGRSIQLVQVSLNPSQKRPAIFMDCGIHAREWVSPAFCLYALDRLVRQGSSGLLNQFDFYIIPVANPDGYVYTWSGNRMWRKNRRPSSLLLFKSNDLQRQFWQPGGGGGSGFFPFPTGYPGGAPQAQQQAPSNGYPGGSGGFPGFPGASSSSKCWGTDPNRNFDIGHGTVGSSNNPCQDTYHGDRPFSEAESQALRDGLQTVAAEHSNVIYVSVHAYSQLWMFPNGHLKTHSRHHNDLKRVSQVAVNKLRSMYGTSFKSGPIATVIYEAAGSSVDWAHSKLGIKYAFALELRDQGQHGFMLPVSQIQPTVEETWDGIVGMANEISKELVY